MVRLLACCPGRVPMLLVVMLFGLTMLAGLAEPASAQTPPTEIAEVGAEDEIPIDSQSRVERQRWFTEMMTGARLKGRFTINGQSQTEFPEEEYTIIKCEKLEQGDLYRFTARIKYGDVDQEMPLDLPVKWAGDTPVISLTNMWLPGLGTFSTRVLFYHGSYAGTWTHGDVGGHMFGTITRIDDAEGAPATTEAADGADQ